MTKIKNVLITCSGNTARSPVGEYLTKFYSKKYDMNLNVESAGEFNAFSYMQPESQEFLNSKNIDHSDFHPQPLTTSLLKKQDLIITMAGHHKKHIFNNYSQIQGIKDKTFTIKEFTGGKGDVIDPYYENNSTYFKVMKELDKLIETMVLKIKEMNDS